MRMFIQDPLKNKDLKTDLSDASDSSDSIVFERSYDGSISSSPPTSPPATEPNLGLSSNIVQHRGQKTPGDLMLLSLLEHFCSLYVHDEGASKRLFELLCEKLCCMKLIPRFGTLDDLRAVRQKYQEAFVRLMSVVLESMQSTDVSLTTEKLWLTRNKENITVALPSRYKEMFHEENQIACGGFGEVVKAKNKLDQKYYAIKKIKLIESESVVAMKTLREVQVFSNLYHPNIVRYHTSWLEYGISGFTELKKDEYETGVTDNQMNNAHLYEEDFQMNSMHSEMKGAAAGYNDEVFIADVKEISSLRFDGSSFGNFNVSLVKNGKIFQKYISYHDNEESENNAELQDAEEVIDSSKIAEDSVDLSESPKYKIAVRKRNPSLSRSLSSGDIPFNRDKLEEVNYCRGKFYDANLRKALDMTLFIQMELCHLTLREWLDARNHKIKVSTAVDKLTSIKIFKQCLVAIQYIHDEGLIHRDIKPSNIFINCVDGDNMLTKIGDFGLARNDNLPKTPTCEYTACTPPITSALTFQPQYFTSHTAGVGTTTYAAPEQQSSQNYSCKVDIFSMGIILFELFRVFITAMERTVAVSDLLSIHRTCGDIEEIWKDECGLIFKMTLKDSNMRLSAKSILDSIDRNQFTYDELKSKLREKDMEIVRLKQLLKESEARCCSQCQLLN